MDLIWLHFLILLEFLQKILQQLDDLFIIRIHVIQIPYNIYFKILKDVNELALALHLFEVLFEDLFHS